ncbi:trypsin-like peptidase domain-containing protein [Streptomyces sp. NPDC048506]|uniref:trypsin-like peptidase domain-containing protein n=1 Tax=Streptomyces sp. NPDC048506 TaxID=3155028 RepID=UPI0034367EBC
MSHFDKARVAEILVRRGAKAEYGSGYRISSQLVLTVAHLLDSDGDPSYAVRLGGGDVELFATPVWRAAGQDLALLRLDSTTAAAAVPPVAFGSLPDGIGRVPFMGIGFPAFALRRETADVSGLRRRDSREVGGFVQLGSNLKSGLLDLTVITAPPQDRTSDPWKGMSGAALFTEDGRLLIGVQAQRLPAAGTGSAEAEPITRALQDPQFEDILLLNGVPPRSVQIEPPGKPPGNPLRAVLPQQELVDGFGDFKKNLTSDHLPFVSPGDDHPAHPRRLFRKLLKSDGRGVLLVGAAGTGKTRTGIEVGNEALKVGWRVLHVMPGDDREMINELIERTLAEPTPVLVVIDYLNESQLDPAVLRHRLIPEARRNDITVAVLASVRPGWLRKADRARLHELFDEVELRQDDSFQRLVTENALRKLAPSALRQLGMVRMMEVSGRRPIIALLIAREIERRVKAGHSLPEAAAQRSGNELSAWLESRLREDGLTIPGRADDFTPARASSGLLAAAAAAAASPQPLHEITAAAHASLVEAASATPRAEDVVATLISLGWLEQHNGVLAIAHDAVADQLMESVLLPESDTSPDVAWTHALLAGCLTDPRTIGRFAVNVGRLANDLGLAERSEALTPVLDSWFAANAAAIGQILRRSSDVGGYALGAICSGAPWSGSAVRCWEQVVDPWLRDFGASVDARHLLYRGLRNLSPGGALLLVPTALAWLRTHWRILEASYVLSPLVARADLPPETVQEAAARTLSWLDRHATAADARFVIRPLLFRTELSPRDSGQVIAAAFAWLDRHAAAADARFVLRPLLSRTDLGPWESAWVVSATLAWLDRHAAAADARFVLRPLLSHADLGPADRRRALAPAFVWLDRHAVDRDAQFVLRPLLSRVYLGPTDSQRAAALALAWLDRHAVDRDAQFVLRPLLSRAELSPEHARRAISSGLAWLDCHAAAADARFVIRPLLSRADLGPQDTARAVSAASGWLKRHAAAPDSQFVLGRLAELSGSVPASLAWLPQPDGQEQASTGQGTSNWVDEQVMRPLGVPLPGAPAPADSLLRYDLAIRTTHSPPTPPGLAVNELEIPWVFGEEADPKSATIDALRASGLTLGDTATRIVYIAPPGALALATYAAMVGFTHRWLDAYADGRVLELADSRSHTEGVGDVVKPGEFLHWAQVGGPHVDGMLTVPFPPEPDGWLDERTAGAVRYAARLRMVAPDSASAALGMLTRVGTLRTKGSNWRLPVLSTGTEPLPVDKSTQGQGLDLEGIRQAAQLYRKELVQGNELTEVVPVPRVSPFNQRIAEANATDPLALLGRLGAASDDGLRWTCPRDRGDHADLVLKVRDNGLVTCKRCYPRAVGLVRLTVDTLLLTPDEAAAFIMNDSGDHPDRFPAPGMAVTARVVGSAPDGYRCAVHNPATGQAYEAVLPMWELQELHNSLPGLRLGRGDTLVALVLELGDGALSVGPSALEGGALVLSLTATALVERVLAGFVPELTTGELAITGIARVPGARTRIAVAPTRPTNSVRGFFIGKRAERIVGSQRLLSGGMTNEEIEIVPYSSDQRTLLANALAYAQPTDILTDGQRAVVAVPRHQLRGAIGRGGLNAQLAGQLTGLYVKIVPSGTDLRLAMESGFDDE